MKKIIKMCSTTEPTSDSDVQRAAEIAISENPLNEPKEEVKRSLDLNLEEDKIRLAMLTGKKWKPGRTLNISFLNGKKSIQDKVKHYIKEWEKYVNLKFNFIDEPNGNIRIAFDKDPYSYSKLGTDAEAVPINEHTMHFGWLKDTTPDDEYSRVVLHEFGHALGYIHEHLSPTADIPWDREKVYEFYSGPPNNWRMPDGSPDKARIDFNILNKEIKPTNFSEFDENSIMLYSVDNELTIGDFEIPMRTKLSETDKKYGSIFYPFESTGVSKLGTLQNGSTGNQVKLLQAGLTILDHTLGSIDGDFGPKTLNAVKQFQNDKGLPVNGIVDNNTWSKLLSSLSGKLGTLQNGSTGNQARFLQAGLTILEYTLGSIDGDFGPKTLNAVKQFQNDKGLPVNGIVDNNTWSKLLSSF